MQEFINLRKAINCARRCRATIEQVYVILGLIEIDAIDTPFFFGIKGNDLIIHLLSLLNIKEREFFDKYIDEYTIDDFLGFLSTAKQLKFKVEDLKSAIALIKEKGEELYEFRNFVREDAVSPDGE